MTGIRVCGLTKYYGDMLAVNAIDFEIGAGQFVTLLGPSGCGKTTTLRCIAGLEIPDSGDIFLGDRHVNGAGISVPTHQRRIGMVFQSFAVWPHMTVFDNVAYPLRIVQTATAETKERTQAALDLVGLGSLGKRFPSELSGGQQQRVALARAVVAAPDIILYDEPLSSLDARLREQMRFELRALHDRLGTTALYVTHDQQEAMVLSDCVHIMQGGVIAQSGSPETIYNRPSSLFVSEFIGSTNAFSLSETRPNQGGLVAATSTSGLSFLASCPAENHRTWKSIVVRPHRVRIGQSGSGRSNEFKGRVAEAVFLGDRVRYTVELGKSNTMLVEELAGYEHFEPGMEVVLTIDPRDCVLV